MRELTGELRVRLIANPLSCVLAETPGRGRGVVNLRGSVIPVVDFSARLGGSATETTERHTIIIVESGEQTIGLLVDAVSDILTADDETMQPTPQIAPPEVHEIIAGLFVVEDRILRKVVARNIIGRENVDEMTLTEVDGV